MKKIQLAALLVLFSLFLASACGSPDPGAQPEARSVAVAQLFDGDAGQFSLEGQVPGTSRQTLENTAGFLQGESVRLEGLPANLEYAFEGEGLTSVSYTLDTQGLDEAAWSETAVGLYDQLNRFYGSLAVFVEGNPVGPAGGACTYFAGAPGKRTMLCFRTAPPEASSPALLRIEITGDAGDFQDVTEAYRAAFLPANDELVNAAEWIPGLYVELKYATSDNFIGQVIYDFTDAYLRYGTVEKLIRIQAELSRQGYSLKIYDAFRPVSAQFKLWEAVPDPTFVANPYTGYSTHSRGNTVDLTLVTLDGRPVEMPTPYDTFSPQADRDYSDVSEAAAAHARILEKAVIAEGFKVNPYEWWHYYDIVSYPVAKDFEPAT